MLKVILKPKKYVLKIAFSKILQNNNKHLTFLSVKLPNLYFFQFKITTELHSDYA
jgi:hypothetical protein